ncbi:hypothetical protein [Mycobacterium paraffinicum]|uniref:hypothetical protein n=1 Tax=Mycobacterium paraffinicum TaxID=53378 RepID=UPI0032670128
MFANLLGWAHIAGVEAVLTSPCSGVSTNSFNIKNFLGGCQEFVARSHARVRSIAVATQLDGLYLQDLLGQWLFRGENLIDLVISRICYVGQSASKVVDCVSAGVESCRLRLVLLREIEMKFLALLVSGYEVVRCVPLIACRDHHPLTAEALREELLLRARLAPMLGTGPQSHRRFRPPGPNERCCPLAGRQVSPHRKPFS